MLEWLVINSFFIIGLYEATESGGILASLHDYLERKLPEWIYKPLLGCVYCMASVWGSLFFFLFICFEFQSGNNTFYWYKILYLPFYIGAVSGLTFVIYQIVLQKKI